MADRIAYAGEPNVRVRMRILDAAGVPVTGLTAADIPSISTMADNESAATVYDNSAPTIEGLNAGTPGIWVAPTPTYMRFGEVDPVNHKGEYELQFEGARFPVTGQREFRIMLKSFTTPVTATPAVSLVDDILYVVEIDYTYPEAAGANVYGAAIANVVGPLSQALVLASGTATAGGASTITLQTALGADGRGKGCVIVTYSGTGSRQTRIITGYVNSTKVVTVDEPWDTNPNNTTVYYILSDRVPALAAGLKVTGVALVDLLTAYTGNTPQTGDAYAIVNSGTFGNSALKTLIDLIATYVDTEVAAIKSKTDNLPASPASTTNITAAALGATERDAIAAAILDLANALETGITLRKAMRAIAAMAAGKVSGMDTNAPVFRSIGDTKNVISATTTADGNRTAVTTDLT